MINVSHCRQLTAGHSLIQYATAGHGPSESLLKNMARGIVALVFLCRPVGEEERTSSESVDVQWFTGEEVESHMLEAYSVRVLDALDSDAAQVRAHDGRQLVDSAHSTAVSAAS